MSLYDSASLVMIPSGIKDGKLYSIKPDDGVGDFTFTRGSNLAATRVDENGLIEKGRENLLLQSNQFDATWTYSGTLIDGQTDKDGGINAWSFTPNTGASGLGQNVSATGVKTFSVYIKKNATNGVQVYMYGGLNVSPFFNLNTGSVVSFRNAIDAKIEEYNVDWWRISVTTPDTPINSIYLFTTDNSTTQVVGTITFQDAQFELGLVATDYIETGATTEQAGILENLPRLDYTDSSCPSLLLEPTRQNLVTQSEYFGDSSWTKPTGSSVSLNSIVTPEGNLNGYTFKAGTLLFSSLLRYTIAKTVPLAYSFSVYVKKSNYRYVALRIGLASNGLFYNFYDFDTDTIDNTNVPSAPLTRELLDNGWVRLSQVFTTTTGNNDVTDIALTTNTGSVNFVPTGTEEVYLYGAQLEAGSYPTSYIPTYGTSVTRSGDVCVGAGDATTFNDNEGVLFVDLEALSDVDFTRYFGISDSSESNMLMARYSSSGFLAIIQNSATLGLQTLYSDDLDLTQRIKLAIQYGSSTSDYKVYINGSSVTISGSFVADSLVGLNIFEYRYPTGVLPFNGRINQSLYFPTALTDSELAALTTI